ncbi:uncharacterized protein Z520_02476 [Fonsecaea multimorphosa CBS 102226]|uniref:NTF2-like domain-containing protein n=1 Tax=Fonsecaea multimorphosa CBS 102226 TaxID=1442371 RepID=A0A0D2K8D6_9EURO|nr:uncharacterized protein Z520_02476 [Fonsecaea multimorphosa CBS 102226]KIY02338.1 hypothetical protein Z520_02476 [Fonsecaea multimorphosa CBS 102226]OAL28982.1 hypothetical protein AYO22_02418 [Fonsecaea multimorphosa]
MWTSAIAVLLLASGSSAAFLDLLVRATKLCPAVVDSITATSTLSVIVPPITVTVTPSLPLATPSALTATGCLSDAQATNIVSAWKTILTSPDRTSEGATAQTLIADEYLENSDSINSLAGNSLGNATFSGKDNFVAAVLNNAAIPLLTTLDVFHDCSRIAFYWAASGVGSGVEDVRGVDLLYVTDDKEQISMAMVEFNSLAWAKAVGWQIVRANGTKY